MTMEKNLRTWGGANDVFQTVRVDAADPESWSAEFRTSENAPMAGLRLQARKTAADERVWISLREAVPPSVLKLTSEPPASEVLRRLISGIEYARAGSVSCRLDPVGQGIDVEIRAVIYQDGFSRHALNVTILEIARAYSGLQEHFKGIMGAARLMDQNRKPSREQDERTVPSGRPPANVSSPAAVIGETSGKVTSGDVAANRPAVPPPLSSRECPSCHAPSPKDSRFCNRCGASLGCPSCGAVNQPGNRFCNQCGSRLVP